MDRPDFGCISMEFESTKRTVLVSKTGQKPVVLMHEILGITEAVLDFARLIVKAGFKVYIPILFGSAQPRLGIAGKAFRLFQFVCVAHEFRVFTANESGPWTNWLRQLLVVACRECNTERGGVIGLCLTGNFALSMSTAPEVLAAVLAEPSLPFLPLNALHITPAELKEVQRRIHDEGLELRAYRYETDPICHAARFERLHHELKGGFIGCTLPASCWAHSVFTGDLRDKSGMPRHDKVQEVICFLNGKL